jgi:hypothetical protein
VQRGREVVNKTHTEKITWNSCPYIHIDQKIIEFSPSENVPTFSAHSKDPKIKFIATPLKQRKSDTSPDA